MSLAANARAKRGERSTTYPSQSSPQIVTVRLYWRASLVRANRSAFRCASRHGRDNPQPIIASVASTSRTENAFFIWDGNS